MQIFDILETESENLDFVEANYFPKFKLVYSNQLYSTVLYMYPYCSGFRLSQLKPKRDIHKNRRPALFASCANTSKQFFQWFLQFLIFTWKENNGNAIPE